MTVRDDIARRDAIDREQMRPAPDAITMYNDHLEPDETVALILGYLRQRQAAAGTVATTEAGGVDEREAAQVWASALLA